MIANVKEIKKKEKKINSNNNMQGNNINNGDNT